MSNIRYTPEAENDLTEIKEYIAGELLNPVAAANMLKKITKRIRLLEQFPEMGTPLSSIINLVTDYRFLVCANYLAFYHIDGSDVFIIRVLYGRRDYITMLFDELPQDETE
jgi:addiction module RelE/StbE family toxin